MKSSLPKVVAESELERACSLAGLERGQYFLMVAGSRRVANDALAALRQHLAVRLGLVRPESIDEIRVGHVASVVDDRNDDR